MRGFPDLLSDDEQKELLSRAEYVWDQLQKNQLGGYSGVNRPFWLLAEFREVIEGFGRRDTGWRWTKDELDAARRAANG